MHKDAPQAFQDWYYSRRKKQGFAPKGTMAGALVVIEHLKNEFDLSIKAHTAEGGSQIKGVSGAAVTKILADFGETRRFVSEGGRTNRGLRGDTEAMLKALQPLGLEKFKKAKRNKVLESCQRFLVDKVCEFHNKQRIKIAFDPSMTTRDLVQQILEKSRECEQSGQVAQYLIGAKLALRFPDLEISNDTYSTADEQLSRAGDFLVNDTAFHVTMTPMDKVYDRCKQNAEQGLRAYLLVPDDHVQSARRRAKDEVPGRVAVESIESFVGQNVEEMATFSKDELNASIYKLLTTYNDRVDAVEIDKSVMIEIPPNLKPKKSR